MRKVIRVLWLDDKKPETNRALKRMREECCRILNIQAYDCEIIPFTTYKEAIQFVLSPERYDIILTDYNIDEEKTGVDFLVEIREKQKYTQHVTLYSQWEESKIKERIISAINEGNLRDFTNFSFFSTAPGSGTSYQYINDTLEVYLSRWRELNVLRGRFMVEHAELEFKLKDYFGIKESENGDGESLYSGLINNFKSEVMDFKHSELFKDWTKSRKDRNDFAHVVEGFDLEKGYFITLKSGKLVYESQIDDYRKKLVNDAKAFHTLLDEMLSKKSKS